MELSECKTPFEVISWLVAENKSDSGMWAGKRNKYVHFCDMAVQYAFFLGQQSRALPVYVSVPDVPRFTDEGVLLQPKKYEGPDRRKTPRGDVARGLVDAALVGGDVQEID